MVATDGSLDAEEAARFAESLADEDGRVTVLSVVEIPRRLLQDLRTVMGEQQEAGVIEGGEWVDTPAVPSETPRSWPGDDAVIKRYLDDKCNQYSGPILSILEEHGVAADGVAAEHEKPAQAILEQIEALGPDVLVIGSHGQGAFSGLLGSTGTKLVRQSPIPVLLIRDGA
jgi:nucleotide-binding universal stress UspA family protein